MAGDSHQIDSARSACLCDVGAPGYVAAVAIAADGSQHLILGEVGCFGDERVRYDADCTGVEHEQLGQLPLEFVRRITVSQRKFRCSPNTLRCGRPTKSGTPCRIAVMFEGEACAWHRTTKREAHR